MVTNGGRMTRIREGGRDHVSSALRQRTKWLVYRTPVLSDLYFGAKQVLFQIPVVSDLFDYRYGYMFSPAQLAFFCEQLTDVAAVPGSILEVGCAWGRSTVFLNRHLDSLGVDVDYYAVDTFSGFTPQDLESEQELGRDSLYYSVFRGNSKARFDRTMQRNGVTRVTSFQADASTFDYAALSPFRMVLVDVDLHRPVLATLHAVYDLVSPGGVIVIDDCKQGGIWEGAYEAFTEFAAEMGVEPTIVHDKLGVIVKQRT